ncbi:hypothetical protein J6590_094490 [Homalodisca vitripennis]|nr:hypothetical protein J6590_094490 [Homalodisca vitripennis]
MGSSLKVKLSITARPALRHLVTGREPLVSSRAYGSSEHYVSCSKLSSCTQCLWAGFPKYYCHIQGSSNTILTVTMTALNEVKRSLEAKCLYRPPSLLKTRWDACVTCSVKPCLRHPDSCLQMRHSPHSAQLCKGRECLTPKCGNLQPVSKIRCYP